MMLKYRRLPCAGVDMCIYLGSQDALMPQHLLHDPQVRPVLYQMSGERMPEGMRGNLLVHTGEKRLLLDHIEY